MYVEVEMEMEVEVLARAKRSGRERKGKKFGFDCLEGGDKVVFDFLVVSGPLELTRPAEDESTRESRPCHSRVNSYDISTL